MRRVGYGIVGLLIGAITYVMFLVSSPTGVIAKTTLIDFAVEDSSIEDEYVERYTLSDDGEYIFDEDGEYVMDEDGEYVLKEHLLEEDYLIDEDEEYLADDIVPFLEYGSYHVTSSDINVYEKNNTVSYGKPNPMYYSKKIIQPVEDDEKKDNEENNDNEENPNEPIVFEPGRGSSTVTSLTGYNIIEREMQVDNVEDIALNFSLYGKLPVDKNFYKVSSKYGTRTDPFKKVEAFHVGLDISDDGIQGKNIYSMLPGEVVESVYNPDDKDGFGNYIFIKHDGFETLYGHMLTEPLFEKGDKVEAGDIIGYVGNTGRSTAPHLHVEVGKNGLMFDPEIFIDLIK